jgi:PAS domain S-box-containing protein
MSRARSGERPGGPFAADAAGRRDGRVQQLLELLDALPTAIYTTDVDGVITYYNEAAAKLAGRRPRVGVDKWCVSWRLLTPDGEPLAHDACPMAIALREDRPVRGVEAIALRPDGGATPLLACPSPLHDRSGALIGAVNMLIDLGERKAAEERQMRLFAELNHRIKNNMQLLHGLLSAAARETTSAEAREVLAGAVRRIGAMGAALKGLYQSGSVADYRARPFMASVCEAVRQPLGDGVSVTCRACDTALSNDTATALALIVNELVANAARFSADASGRVRVDVDLAQDKQDPCAFVLTVEDDGPGFELTAPRRRSTGLGLVTGLAAQLGGRLEVTREPKSRCTVRFRDDRTAR